MAEPDANAFLVAAQRGLQEGRFEDAKRAIEEGRALAPQDETVRELYQQILIADGVRLSRKARDLRRDEIRTLDKRDRPAYRNSEDVEEAFQSSLDSFDKVLAANPDNSKAMMLKAGVLDRLDREGMRASVLELFDRALALHPENEELVYARSRIIAPCSHCQGSGLCGECQGAGEVSALLMKGRCPACKGSGVCIHCGLL